MVYQRPSFAQRRHDVAPPPAFSAFRTYSHAVHVLPILITAVLIMILAIMVHMTDTALASSIRKSSDASHSLISVSHLYVTLR